MSTLRPSSVRLSKLYHGLVDDQPALVGMPLQYLSLLPTWDTWLYASGSATRTTRLQSTRFLLCLLIFLLSSYRTQSKVVAEIGKARQSHLSRSVGEHRQHSIQAVDESSNRVKTHHLNVSP